MLGQPRNQMSAVRDGVHIAACVSPGFPYALLEQVVGLQGWELAAISPSDLSQSRAAWNLVVLGADRIDAEILTLIAASSRNHGGCVLVISADRDPQHVADALRAGADDYIVSPFAPEECAARMQNLFARSTPSPERRAATPMLFDFDRHTISAGPYTVVCSPDEWQLLLCLLEAEGEPVPTSELSLTLYGSVGREAELRTIVEGLRDRLSARQFRAIQLRIEAGRHFAACFRRTGDSLPHDRRSRCHP